MAFCPQCGVENPAAARYCDQCGAALVAVPAAGAQPAAPAPAAPIPPTAPIATPPAPLADSSPSAPAALAGGSITCPQCGTAAFPGEAFCDNCGAPLSAPPRASVPAPPFSPGLPPQPVYPAPQAAGATQVTPPVTPGPVPPLFNPAPAPLIPPTPVPGPTLPNPRVLQPPPAGARSVLAPARLVIVATGQAIPLPAATQATVGRADPVSKFAPDIDLTAYGALDLGVGRRHARLFIQSGQVMVEDLDSTNGTQVNGSKLAPRQPVMLNNGDQIQFGRLGMQFLV